MANPRERFPLAPSTPKPRLIARSGGDVGSGKTHFWLTAPDPILVFNFDDGLEGVVEPFREAGKEIRIAQYDWNPGRDVDQQAAIDIRDQFLEDYTEAGKQFRTLLVDKEGDLWKIFRYAEFGAETGKPRNFPKLYADYRRMLNQVKPLDCNFGIIQGLGGYLWKTVVKKNGDETMLRTSDRELAGCDEADPLVHITLFHRRENGQFYIDVGKSRGPGGHNIQDTTIGPNLTFAEFAMMAFPDSSAEDWGA